MSGSELRRTPEQAEPKHSDSEPLDLSFRSGAFDAGASNSDRAVAAERVRATRQDEMLLRLPDLGTPTRGVWEEAFTDAFGSGLKGFVSKVPKAGDEADRRTGAEALGDAGQKFASKAAASLVETGLAEIGGTRGAIDLAKEYPVPAAVLATAAGYGASAWLDGKPKLKLKLRLKPINEHLSAKVEHNLKTGENKFELRFKYEW